MKTAFALATLFASVSAFAPSAKLAFDTRLSAERINTKIDLDSPKVATMDAMEEGQKKVYCRCWQSGTFPLCDAAHVAHNKETGDNVGPLIVSGPKKAKKEE